MEYKFFFIHVDSTIEQIEETLNAWAGEGWRVVQVWWCAVPHNRTDNDSHRLLLCRSPR